MTNIKHAIHNLMSSSKLREYTKRFAFGIDRMSSAKLRDYTKMLALGILHSSIIMAPAIAQSVNGANPFSAASSAANSFESSLVSFALAVGGIGMVSCLMLGFFGKLNWRWVATGVGVSFAISGVAAMISYLSSLNAMSSGTT